MHTRVDSRRKEGEKSRVCPGNSFGPCVWAVSGPIVHQWLGSGSGGGDDGNVQPSSTTERIGNLVLESVGVGYF
ncbi:hypothetical protein PGQ11_010729 [Apiospora arundinis]|uniref:Uncharacterized protein n=1 Tax=Apiospora arundinis TaxID=335852 RepID=A0ABR2ICL5_9PEZI